MGQDFQVVRSLTTLEADHVAAPYAAIVLGGGALVTTRTLRQALPGHTGTHDYPIGLTWVHAALVATKFGVPLLWNSPDVPLPFSEAERDIGRVLIDSAKYLSVRNTSSRQNLVDLGISRKEINIVPDTAFTMAQYGPWTAETVTSQLSPEPYFVVHLNAFISDAELGAFADALRQISSATVLRPRLVALSNTHGDRDIAQKLDELLEGALDVSRASTLATLASEIRGSAFYVGVSYHGIITALAAGVPAVAFNYMQYAKTRDLMDSIEMKMYYAETAAEIARVFRSPLGVPDRSRMIIDNFGTLIDVHFDELARFIKGSENLVPEDVGSDSNLVAGLILKAFSNSARSDAADLAFANISESMNSSSTSVGASLSALNESLGLLVNDYNERMRRIEEFMAKSPPQDS
jgi:hypothetical protein